MKKEALKKDLKFLNTVAKTATNALIDEIGEIPSYVSGALARGYINLTEPPSENQIRYLEAQIRQETNDNTQNGVQKTSKSSGTSAHVIASQNVKIETHKHRLEFHKKWIKIAANKVVTDLLSSEDSQ